MNLRIGKQCLVWIGLAGSLGCAASGFEDETTDDLRLRTEVVLFTAEHLYYDTVAPRTQVDATVALPSQDESNTFRKVTLELTLSCPETNQCDHWDRPGEFYYLDGDGNAIEFARFMTPYRMGGTWTVDVTDLQTVLTGPLTVRVHITTYVGPNINTQYGKGWVVDAKLTYKAGQPWRVPLAALPLRFGDITYGDPAQPTARSATVEVPEGVGSAGIYMLITGHGQGNVDNCSEFCAKTHTMQIGTAQTSTMIWRGDCHRNPIGQQPGTWYLGRAGWCPGDIVRPWREKLDDVAAGSYQVAYDIEAYENTCRPDSPMCGGCKFSTGCEYNGGNHTRPRFLTNGFVILYR